MKAKTLQHFYSRQGEGQVNFNTRVPTQVNTSQHDSETSQHVSDTSQHESGTSQHKSKQVNTSQHDG